MDTTCGHPVVGTTGARPIRHGTKRSKKAGIPRISTISGSGLAGEPGAGLVFLEAVYFQLLTHCRVNNVGVVCGGVNIGIESEAI